MNIKLLFIPLLLFSSQLYAETIHLGILNTSGNEAENVLTRRLPPYSRTN